MPNLVALYQYSHLGERVHGLNMMISIGGHFVFRFPMSEPQHLGHCYFFQFSITHKPKQLERNIIFEIIKSSVRNGGHYDFNF